MDGERKRVEKIMKEIMKFLRFIPKPSEPNVAVVDHLTYLIYEAQNLDYQQCQKEYDIYNSIYEEILNGNIQISNEFIEKNFPFYKKNLFIPVTEEHRKRHTYITGATGSGKSELIKSFIWHYLSNYQSSSIVLIAPENDICEQVAKFNVNYVNGKLVYIKPSLQDGFFPCMNPFDIPNKSSLTTEQAEKLSKEFISVFLEALESVGAETSAVMEIFLKSIIPVLMKYENSSILNLLDFLEASKENNTARKYIEFAEVHFSDNKEIAKRLHRFMDGNMTQTRNAIYTRLQIIFGSYVMQKLFVGKSTINFKDLLLQKKLIVINLPKGEMLEESKVIGKMIVAMIKNVAQQKYSNFYCHLFIDEFHNFTTKSIAEILEELRKFNLFLTIAHQQVGQGLTPDLTNSILGNAGVKLIGLNNRDTLNVFSKETGIMVKTFQENLSKSVFACWKTSIDESLAETKFIRTPKITLGHKKSMTNEQWQQIEIEQIQKYYRLAKSQLEIKQPETNPIMDDIHAHLN